MEPTQLSESPDVSVERCGAPAPSGSNSQRECHRAQSPVLDRFPGTPQCRRGGAFGAAVRPADRRKAPEGDRKSYGANGPRGPSQVVSTIWNRGIGMGAAASQLPPPHLEALPLRVARHRAGWGHRRDLREEAEISGDRPQQGPWAGRQGPNPTGSSASACGERGSVSQDVSCQLGGLGAQRTRPGWTQPRFSPPARASRSPQEVHSASGALPSQERGCE